VDITPYFDQRRVFREWEPLCQRVPLIITYARDTGEPRIRRGRPSNLDPAERMLSFVLCVKHNTSIRYESSSWNWNRSSACDDVPFIASVINCTLADEISWPSPARRAQLDQVLPEFPGCIGHIGGTLYKINRPSVPERGQHYNRRKHMYCFKNNVVVIDHGGISYTLKLDLQVLFTMSDVFEVQSCTQIAGSTSGMIIWM
jgi:hypothetical protein